MLTPPARPAGTIAAFATTLPSRELSVETSGCGLAAGQSVRNPSPPCGTAVTFSEKACALVGIPHWLDGMPKSRLAPLAMNGPPKAELGNRVSTARQGITG